MMAKILKFSIQSGVLHFLCQVLQPHPKKKKKKRTARNEFRDTVYCFTAFLDSWMEK